MIRNPIIPGFHPDPSAVRVGDVYYVATSTFNWFPGVEILKSTNLRDWEVVSRPLSDLSLLDMRGEEPGEGIWAPNLSYSDGLFYLVYTDMKNSLTKAKDLDNWLITAPDIRGPWSERIYLNSTGFDPALFHDDDGRKYLINIEWDFRPGHNRFGGIVMQEYDSREKKLTGPVTKIDRPSGIREGSNLYKIDGYYYLMIAEGGTGAEHSCVISRSKNIYGPYEDMPGHFLMTSRYSPSHPLQRAGHGSLVSTPDGQWYILFLASRPLLGCSILGRECCLEKLERNDEGWFRLKGGTLLPRPGVEPPFPLEKKKEEKSFHYTFEKGIPDAFFSPRAPLSGLCETDAENGVLTLRGRRSLFSNFDVSALCRRVTDLSYDVSTAVEYESGSYHKSAGLVVMYDRENFFFLERTHNEEKGEVVVLSSCCNGEYSEEGMTEYREKRVYLKAEGRMNKILFLFSRDNETWTRIGGVRDALQLSDERCRIGRYTGTMTGVAAVDLTGGRKSADFLYFDYLGKEEEEAEWSSL